MLLIHIIIALFSLLISGILVIRPTHALLRASHLASFFTVFTGVMLIIEGFSIVHVCVSGLIFACLAVVMSSVAKRKLAAQAAV